jgi:hypothetical protein
VVGSSGSVHAFEAQRVLSQLVCSNAATNQVRVAATTILSVVICALAGLQHPLHQQGIGRIEGRNRCSGAGP